MEFVTVGWKDGPTTKRELKNPSKIKKDNIFFTAFGIVYFLLFVIWETTLAFGSFLRKMIFVTEPKSLKGRVCLVTGAGRGLGREFCLALAREGAVLACADINEPNNKTTAAMVEELGVKAVPYVVNIAIKKDVEELVCRIEKELGPIFLTINNAALVYSKSTVDEEFIRASFNINTFGPIWLMNAVLPTMKMRNEGHIVNIISSSTMMVVPPLNVYGATKIALHYWSNCVRAELQLSNKDNIFVTNVYPSFINTSEDYVRSLQMKINLVVEMEEVVKPTMDAIHYNYEEVVVPSIMKYGLLLVTGLMPSRTSTKLFKLMFKTWNLPNKEQEEFLPFNGLIKGCSFLENKKE